TALTQSGRGRIPYFSRLYRTNLLERGGFNYYKQVFGSLKHKVPDDYTVGYYLTTHLRRKYGADVLANILDNTTWLMPFPIAVKKATGKSIQQIYKDTNEELKDLWQQQLEGLRLTPATSMMTRKDEVYTDYAYPQPVDKSRLIVLKAGLGTVAQFVLLDEQQQEHLLFTPGKIDTNVGFSVAQGQIVWTERVPHSRWKDHKEYGVIQRYDIQQKRLKTLTHQSRYSTAALSPDATKIVAVESDTQYHHRLVILDAFSGTVLHYLPNPENCFYLTPKWLANGQQIVAIKHHQQQATITLIDTQTGVSQDLMPYSTAHIGVPVPYGQYIFYNSAYNGIDNIYALDLNTHQRYQVTSRKYGAYNAAISTDGHWIIFNDFTKDGMEVVKMPLAPQQWTPLAAVEDRSIHYYAPLVVQENNGNILDHVPSRTYPITRYYPWKHLLNIHSWAWPLHTPPQGPQYALGLVARSEDLFNTTEASAGYLYDVKRHTGETSAQLSYKGWYPVVTLAGKLKKDLQGSSSKKKRDTEKEIGLTLALPLTFQRGQYTHFCSFSTVSSFHKKNGANWFSQTYKFLGSRAAKKSPRDLYSPWQQQLRVVYTHPHCPEHIYRQNRQAVTTLIVETTFRFPGLFKHHSFCFIPQYKRQVHTEDIGLDLNELFPFLYKRLDVDESIQGLLYQKKERTYQIEVAYDWPICYLDWNVGNLLYVRQLKAHLFYEPKYQSAEAIKYSYQVGAGATIDVESSFWFLPFGVGVKMVCNRADGKLKFWPTFHLEL
ncbi:MAG: hypothetical protein AAF963_02815, partial [Bacteroidota bacterium]